MNPVFYLGLLFGAVLITGCMQTDTQPAQIVPVTVGTPTTVETTVVQPTFAPIPAYATQVIAAIPKSTSYVPDPILGKWELVGNQDYQCTVIFRDDQSGDANCGIGFIPVANEDFTWNTEGSEYNFMRNYTVTRKSNNATYNVMWSEHTGNVVSDMMPDGTYLTKVE